MDTYSAVLIYKRNNFEEFILKESFNFKNLENAKIAYKEILCQLSKRTRLSFTYHDNISHIGKWTVKLIKKVPIVYKNVDSFGDLYKASFDKEEVLRDINYKNALGECCHLETIPQKFED